MVDKIALSKVSRTGLGLIVVAFGGWLFGASNLFGFCLGLGGLLLVYSGFKVFWLWLERRYTDD